MGIGPHPSEDQVSAICCHSYFSTTTSSFLEANRADDAKNFPPQTTAYSASPRWSLGVLLSDDLGNRPSHTEEGNPWGASALRHNRLLSIKISTLIVLKNQPAASTTGEVVQQWGPMSLTFYQLNLITMIQQIVIEEDLSMRLVHLKVLANVVAPKLPSIVTDLILCGGSWFTARSTKDLS